MVAQKAEKDGQPDKSEENLWLEKNNDALPFKPIDARRRPARGSGRAVKFLLGFLVVAAVGAAWAVWGGEMFGTKSQPVPLIKAEAGPIKTRPERPGGLLVPNRDKLIYERLERKPPKSTTETLLPRPEVPLPPSQKPDQPLAPQPRLAWKDSGASDLPLVVHAKRRSAPPAVPELPSPKINEPKKTELPLSKPASPEPVIAAITPPPARLPPNKPAPATSKVTLPPNGFLIQIAAVRSEDAARKEWRRLKAKHAGVLGGLKLVLVRADLGAKGIYYRLRAGSFVDREAAKSTCDSLAKLKIGCLIIRPGR